MNVTADDDFLWRRLMLGRACRQGLKIVIDGVDLDLNHRDLDRSDWEPLSLLGDYPIPGLEPSLDLPWTNRGFVERLRKNTPVLAVEPGDRLIVSRVEPATGITASLGAFDHPHHRERRAVYLSVVRGKRKMIPAPGCWLFGGVADVMTPIALHELGGVRRALITRFERMVGVQDLVDHVDDFSEEDWNSKFEAADEVTRNAAYMLWKAEDCQDHAGMAFGYLIGRAEAREGRKAQAKSASKGLRKTGDPARWSAITVIDGSPNILLRRCAEQVAENLGKNWRSIEPTIKPLFKATADGSFRPDPQMVEAFRAKLGAQP